MWGLFTAGGVPSAPPSSEVWRFPALGRAHKSTVVVEPSILLHLVSRFSSPQMMWQVVFRSINPQLNPLKRGAYSLSTFPIGPGSPDFREYVELSTGGVWVGRNLKGSFARQVEVSS